MTPSGSKSKPRALSLSNRFVSPQSALGRNLSRRSPAMPTAENVTVGTQNDVSSTTGYRVEDETSQRNSNGFGGTHTKLPEGHLARRDNPATKVKSPK